MSMPSTRQENPDCYPMVWVFSIRFQHVDWLARDNTIETNVPHTCVSMDNNSKEAKRFRAYRQGWDSDGFKEVERKSSDIGLSEVISVSKPDETLRAVRGHDFFPKNMRDWPELYATDGDGGLEDKVFVAHYFSPTADWYVCEIDSETLEGFGYADLGVGGGEFGYFDLKELEAVNTFGFSPGSRFPSIVERDLHFQSGTQAKDVIEKYKPVAEKHPTAVEDLDENERRELDSVTSKSYEFAKRVDSPFPRESDRREFSTWCAQRYLRDRSTYLNSGYSLATERLASQRT